SLEAVDGGVDVRLPQQHAGVVDQVAGGEVVRPVRDHVVVAEDLKGVRGGEARLVGDDAHVGVDVPQALLGGDELLAADVARPVQDLALQVRVVHHVEVHDPQGAHAGGRQVQGQGRAQAPRPHAEHPGRLELPLSGQAHLGDDQVPGVSADLVVAERGRALLGGGGPTGDGGDDEQRVVLLEGGGRTLEEA